MNFALRYIFQTFLKSKQRIRLQIYGPRNLFSRLWRVTQFPDYKPVRDDALKVLRHNAFFAHPEHLIIAMLSNENKLVRDIALDKVMSLRETLTAGHTDISKETSCEEVKAERKSKVPFINKNAILHHQLVHPCVEAEPSLLHYLKNDKLKSVRQKSMFFKQPCHNKVVEMLNATLSWSLKHPLLWQVLKEEKALYAKGSIHDHS